VHGRNEGTVRRDERGQIGGIEAVVFGTLILVVGVLVVANAWGVVDAKMAASAAAREAARTYVKAPTEAVALDRAVQAGQDTLASLGRHAPGQRVELVSGSLTRCAVVTFRASIPVPVLVLPWLGSFGRGFTASARHSEVVDPYRNELAGTGPKGSAACG